jgi:thiol-disulfide isomerase/thioredoxin
MKNVWTFLLLAASCLALGGPAVGENASSIDAVRLAALELPTPKDAAERDYLGISGQEVLTIPQIAAQVVIVQIFSMYCPYCQKEAPKVNELYRLIEEKPEWRGKIKLIGVGASNTVFEVRLFKRTYQVPFPMFPDETSATPKICNEMRTPLFMGLRINRDGSLSVFYSQVGGFGSAAQFLDLIVEKSGMKGGGSS